MEFENFIKTLSDETPPVSVSAYVQALWYEGKGDWKKRTILYRISIVQQDHGYMPTCTEKKVIMAMRDTGIVWHANLFLQHLCNRSGKP